jgi:molybdopterin-guanine dinucleotide biosynthesis protein B
MVSIVGNSASGKTTLLEKLVLELKKRGRRIGVLKHAHHGFDLDREGKDSWRYKHAGADTVVIAAPGRLAMIKDDDNSESLRRLKGYFEDVDLILIEGFKKKRCPKIEVFRAGIHESPLFSGNADLAAWVTDSDLELNIPKFGPEEIPALADFIETRYI